MTPAAPQGADREKTMADEIGRKAARKIKARNEGHRSSWFGLGMFGLIGWSIAVPVIIGIVIGQRLDAWLDDRISWTLTMLLLGAGLGCINAWYWIKRESRED